MSPRGCTFTLLAFLVDRSSSCAGILFCSFSFSSSVRQLRDVQACTSASRAGESISTPQGLLCPVLGQVGAAGTV